MEALKQMKISSMVTAMTVLMSGDKNIEIQAVIYQIVVVVRKARIFTPTEYIHKKKVVIQELNK